jgi:MFS family permease
MHVKHIPRPALLAMIFVLVLIEFLHTGMLVFAAAPTMGQIGASPEQYSLVTALYAALAVLAISQMSVLIQRLGWRAYLLASIFLFVAGSWICAAGTTVAGFTAGRALMALGGGAFMTCARMLVNLIPPSPQRIVGVAAFGSALATGMAAAPWCAGSLVGHEAWGGIFLGLALLAIVAAGLALRWLPATAATLDTGSSSFDPGDGLALGGGVFLLLYGLQRLAYDWHGERSTLFVLVLTGLGLLLLAFHGQRRRSQPFLRLEMLRSRRYLTGLAIFTLCYAVLGVFNVVLPQLVQGPLGVAFEQAGQLQTAGLSAALPAFAALLLVVRKRPHATKFYVTGFLLLAASGWRLSAIDPAAPAWTALTPWIGLFGAFVMLGMATTAVHSFKDLQHDNLLFSHAQQLKNMLGQVGIALGAGCTAVVLQERAAMHAARLIERAEAAPAVLARQGSLLAGIDLCAALGWIGVAGAVVLAMQRRFD